MALDKSVSSRDIAAAFRKKAAANKAAKSTTPQKALVSPPSTIKKQSVTTRGGIIKPQNVSSNLNKQKSAGESMGVVQSVTGFLQSQGGRDILGLVGNVAQSVSGKPNTVSNIAMGLAGSPKGQAMSTGRRRRINPTNSRALRRAATRLNSYKRLSKRIDKTLAKLAR